MKKINCQQIKTVVESIDFFYIKKVDFTKHKLQQNIILLYLLKKVKYLNDNRVNAFEQ